MADLSKEAWSRPVLPSIVPHIKSDDERTDSGDEDDKHEFLEQTHFPSIAEVGFRFPFRDRKEARYLVHYVQELSPRIDICDPACSFGTEVPKRAFQYPLLAFSILAFSSLDWCLTTGTDDEWSSTYYSHALQILIPVLNGPIETLDENVLAGIVLLRLYEEISDTDTGTHLLGSTRLLNSASSFASRGGLGEAASWIVLRQYLYLSITRSQPLRVNLERYKDSSSFQNLAAESVANRVVLLCGQALSLGAGGHMNIDNWKEIEQNSLYWYDSAPWPCKPEAAGVLGHESDGFPDLWMTTPAHILAFQHFYLTQLLLAVYNPRVWRPGHEALLERVYVEESIRRNLIMIVGLAISNPTVITASFTAHHTLHAYGAFFTSAKQREQVRGFLCGMSTKTGWRTQTLVETLQRGWHRH